MLRNQGCWMNWLHSRHSRGSNFCYWIKMQLNCLFMSKETRSNGKSWQWHKEIKYERSILIFIWKNLFKYVTVSAHIFWHVPRKEINFLFKCKLLRNDKYLIPIPIFFVLSRMILKLFLLKLLSISTARNKHYFNGCLKTVWSSSDTG